MLANISKTNFSGFLEITNINNPDDVEKVPIKITTHKTHFFNFRDFLILIIKNYYLKTPLLRQLPLFFNNFN
jgi:hypothetical protein